MHDEHDAREAHRKALLRLRVLLLGETETPGLVRGEDARLRVSAELRRLGDAFAASLLAANGREEEQPRHVGRLEADLLQGARAATGSRPQDPLTLLTAAESAEALGVSVSTIYRAISTGKIRAVRPVGGGRSGLRIPTGELELIKRR